MERIKHSVGQGGWNFPHDVAIVQALLNRHRPSTRPLLAIDKVAGGLTPGSPSKAPRNTSRARCELLSS